MLLAYTVFFYFTFCECYRFTAGSLVHLSSLPCKCHAPSVSYGRGWRMINIQLHGGSSCSSKNYACDRSPSPKCASLVCVRWKTLLIALVKKIKGNQSKTKQNNIMNARKEPESISSNSPLAYDFFCFPTRLRVPCLIMPMLRWKMKTLEFCMFT